MKTAALGIIAALMLATPAFAIDTPENQFIQAFENMLNAISGTIADDFSGELDKDGKKILRALKKGEKVGSKVELIQLDKRVLRKAGVVLKSVEKAQKYKPGILGDYVAAMKSAIAAVVREANADAEEGRGNLGLERNIKRITKAIDKSSTKISGIDALWSEKFSKAWKFYMKAWLGFAKAIVQADKMYEKEMKSAGPPSGLKFDVDGKLINNTGIQAGPDDVFLRRLHARSPYLLGGVLRCGSYHCAVPRWRHLAPSANRR